MAEEVIKVVENVDTLFSTITVNGESHTSDRYVPPQSEQTPVGTNQEDTPEDNPQPQQTITGQYVEAVKLNNVLHDLKDSPLTQEVTAIQQAINTLQGRLNELVASVGSIESKIPAQASSTNQLADKDFVNSSIATNTANFLGTYSTLAEIEAIPNPTNNDYAFLETEDASGNNVYDRYKYSGEDEEWLFEYELNNSSFTAEQWATINSGLTSTSVTDAVESLDVASVGGSGKYISAIEETDGKISATEGSIDTAPTSGSDNLVTSGGVYQALQAIGEIGKTAVCDTAGATSAKTAVMAGYTLRSGNTFQITFTTSNSAQTALTLNVNGTGAKPLYINNAVSSATNYTLNSGTYLCRYNGTNYYIDRGYFVTTARNANYATSAGSATSADSATSAGNADTVDNFHVNNQAISTQNDSLNALVTIAKKYANATSGTSSVKSGYVQLGNGFKIQWGRTATNTSMETINLTLSFTNVNSYTVFATREKTSDFSSGGGTDKVPQFYKVSASQFKLDCPSGSEVRSSWIAVGY